MAIFGLLTGLVLLFSFHCACQGPTVAPERKTTAAAGQAAAKNIVSLGSIAASGMAGPEYLHQPIRGFGELWRRNLKARQRIGWALDLEQEHISRYAYEQRGIVNQDSEDNEYLPRPGYHHARAACSDVFRFFEETLAWIIDS